MSERRRSPLRQIRKTLRVFQRGVENALDLMRDGRLSAPYRAEHDVVATEGFLRLRRYEPPSGVTERVGQPLLLIPPLMVTTEVYDISPELSAVSFLLAQGVDVWITDFGIPEEEEGGLQRTLDDHVLAVARAVELVRAETGELVHLGGYSQGGMFAYLTAAYLKGEGLASVITFGSPVDMRKNIPGAPDSEAASKMLTAAGLGLREAIGGLSGLSGAMSSHGFKLASPRQEVKYLFRMLGMLPDKEKLEKALPQRRFLGGDGFIAFPGPALRSFLKEFIAGNRLITGGLVIDGRPTHLGDVKVPILYFVGTRDTFARPAAVDAIEKVAGSSECHAVEIETGHFGLVVGSKAMQITWPSVVEWIHWLSGDGQPPTHSKRSARAGEAQEKSANAPSPVAGLYDLATAAVDDAWGLAEVPKMVANIVEAIRWQLPRLAKLGTLEERTRISPALALAEQAEAIPDAPFFLWRNRAFTYREADERVNQTLHVLREQGLESGRHLGLLMHNHPDLLTAMTAASRLGAVSVVLPAEARGESLRHALQTGEVELLVCDLAHLDDALEHHDGPLLVVGAGTTPLPAGALDLDAARATQPVSPPDDIAINRGRARDLAMLLYTSGTSGLPKAARITNRRWGMAALGSAAAAALSPTDTVYCCLPLHHATGMLVAVGGAMVGGARLVLAPKFSASNFLDEVRLTGANVVFYVGELCRYLVNTPPKPNDKQHPIRLFAGNGMRPDVWKRLLERLGPVQVLEFYGSTEGNAVLANLTGEKIGSLGRPLLVGQRVALVRYDVSEGRFARNADGRLQEVGMHEPGVLLAEIADQHPLGRFDGYHDTDATEAKIIRGAFREGDAWFNTGDLMRRDADGDYWFVDRLGDTFRWKGENVSTEQVQSILSQAPEIALAVVYGVALPGREGRAGMAAIELESGQQLDGARLFELVSNHLPSFARPRFLRIVPAMEVTASMKFVKHAFAERGAEPGGPDDDPIWAYDEAGARYAPIDAETYRELVETL